MGGTSRAFANASAIALATAVQATPSAAQQEGQPLAANKKAPPVAAKNDTRDTGPPIVITGSRIPRTNLISVSPVTTISSKEVKLEGSVAAEELLNQLPQITPDQGAFISFAATGTATVNLRDLGPPRTLILVNGRRLGAGDPQAPVPDVNFIPTSIIQRVEVLTGGATSVYGSDATAGVVNFILDTRLNGLRVDAQASVFQHDNRNRSDLRSALIRSGITFPRGNAVDGGRQDLNAAFGGGFFGGRLHATIYAGYRHYEALTQDQRDYSACAGAETPGSDLIRCGGSPAAFPANFETGFGEDFTVGPNRTFEPGLSVFNKGAPFNYYQRPDRRWTAGGFADLDLGKALNPYVEIMFMDDRSVAQINPSGDFGNTQSINCDNPLLSDQQKSIVCVDGNFVGESILDDQIIGQPTEFIDPVTGKPYFRAKLDIYRRAVESGGRRDDLRHKDLRLLGGFKGNLGQGVNYDASYLSFRSRLAHRHLNDFSFTRLTRALDVVTDPSTGQPACRSALTGEDSACIPWDIFSLEPASPQATAYLEVPSFLGGTVNEQIANANATIDLGEWGMISPWSEESPAINLGGEYRKDTIDLDPDESFQTGDITGNILRIDPLHGSTNVKELFAEARIPLLTDRLVDRLAVEAGYWKSWYRNGGASFATDAYKLGVDLTPLRGLRLRASRQRAVRAPNIVELFTPPGLGLSTQDPCEGPQPKATAAQCALTGVSPAQYGHITPIPDGPFAFFNALVGGNENLQPETSMTRSAGVVLEPRFLPGFNATIDWWDIKLRGAVAEVPADAIIDTCIETGDPVFCSRIHRDSNGSLWQTPQGFIDARRLNIGSFRTRGWDISANYRRGLGKLGSATVELLGTYLASFHVDNGGLSTPFECAGLFGSFCGVPIPHWRHTARATWESPSGISVSLHWRRVGKVTSEEASGQFDEPVREQNAHVPAQNYFDLTAQFRIERKFVLRLGVNNLFDREPPFLVACGGGVCNGNTFPQLYDPLGRYIFAGVTADLTGTSRR